MRRINTLLFSLALALCASPALAGTLATDFANSYQGIWSGTTHYQGPLLAPDFTTRLEGDVEWSVYAPGTFPYTPDAPLPSTEYVYAYQVFETGAPTLSQLSITLTTAANNIGTFTGTANDPPGVAPYFPDLAFFATSPDAAVWLFSGVPPGQNTVGLLFTSPYAPVQSVGRTVDHGSNAIVLPVPSPLNPNAPEPATWVLASFGLAGLGVQVLRRRRQSKIS